MKIKIPMAPICPTQSLKLLSHCWTGRNFIARKRDSRVAISAMSRMSALFFSFVISRSLGSARASRAGIGALGNANFFSVRALRFVLWLYRLQSQCPGQVSARLLKPTREARVLPRKELCSFACARVEPRENFFRPRCEPRLVVFVASLSCEFCEGRISVNCRCNRAKTNAGFHRQHELVQKIAGMRRDDSGPENFVGTFRR